MQQETRVGSEVGLQFVFGRLFIAWRHDDAKQRVLLRLFGRRWEEVGGGDLQCETGRKQRTSHEENPG